MRSYLIYEWEINYLITFLKKEVSSYDFIFSANKLGENENEIGQNIVDANYNAVRNIYENQKIIKSKYKFSEARTDGFIYVELLRMCRNISQKCCEATGWENSKAFRVLDKIKDYIIDKILGD
jgi:hypothetical protein